MERGGEKMRNRREEEKGGEEMMGRGVVRGVKRIEDKRGARI